MPELPASVARHFPEAPDLDDPQARAAAIARLLEDGDRADLAWLATHIPDIEILGWFERHGARRLSRRSRAFWAAVLLRVPDGEPAQRATGVAADAFWPLA